MNISGWDVFIVVGGILQVGGVLMLIRDVVKTYNRTEEYHQRPITGELSHSSDAIISVGPANVAPAHEPTLDERVTNLEAQVESLGTGMKTKDGSFKKTPVR